MNKSINTVLEGIRERLQPQENSEVDFFPIDEAKASPEKAEKHFRSAETAYKQGLELVKNVQAGKGTRSDLESARVLSIKVGEHIAKAKKYGYDPKKIALVQGNGSMVGPGAGAAKTLLNKYHHQASRMDKGGGSSAPASSGGKFDKLVAKLKGKPGVKDPEALAAWIGRKKYGKERFAKMSQKESVDVESLLVFEDVEDVLAFVEGLEALTAEPVDEAKKKCMAQGPGNRRCELSFGHKGPHKMHKDTWESVEKPVVETKTDSVGALLILLRTVSKDLENTLARAGHVMRKNRQGSALIGRGLDIIGDIDKLRKDINSTTFAEGIDPDSEEPVVETKLDLQALGDYRRSNPKEAVAAFKRLKAAAQAWKDQLDSAAAAHTERQRVFLFALQAIRKAVGEDKLRSIVPFAMAVYDDIKDGVADPAMRRGLGALVNSEEIRLGASPVVR